MRHILTLLVLAPLALLGQNCISFTNSSLEGTPGLNSVPTGWDNCAWNPISNPPSASDVLPLAPYSSRPPSHGSTYVGSGHRGTFILPSEFEGISQGGLNVRRGTTYMLMVDVMAHSDANGNIYSGSLQIWGGSSPCDLDSMLWESSLIADTVWRTDTAIFTPLSNYSHIVFAIGNQSLSTGYIYYDNIRCLTSPLDGGENITFSSVFDIDSQMVEVSMGFDRVIRGTFTLLRNGEQIEGGPLFKDLLNFIDAPPMSGEVVYTLVIRDFEGKLKRVLRDVAMVNYSATISPQPAVDILYVIYGSPIKSIAIFDGLGRLVGALSGNHMNRLSIDASCLDRGVHYILINNETHLRALLIN